MRIGINLYPTVGGSGYLATRLGQHLAERGHTVHFITYQRPFSLMWEQTPGVHVDLVDTIDYPLFCDTGPPYTMALASKIVKCAHDPGLDIVHSHYAIPHAVSAFLAREIAGLPYVVTLHGSDVHTLGLDPAYRPVVRHVVEAADAVTSVTEFLRQRAARDLGVRREIRVIPNFVDVDRFAPGRKMCIVVENGCVSVRPRPPAAAIDPDEAVLLHASNFRRVKRVVGLVEAMRVIVDHRPNTRLVIVGDGPTRVEVERAVERLDLCDNVHLLGVRSNMEGIMCAADVFVLNSTLEGMPLVLLEAMACGLPVVTTPAGGVTELVRPGVDGVVTKGFGQDELVAAVLDLVDDEDLRARLSEAGRRRVVERFSADRVVGEYEQVFESVVAS